MDSVDYRKIVRNYCLGEMGKDASSVARGYQERLYDYIHYSLLEPDCWNCHAEAVNDLWIDPRDIVLANGFQFYHHSPKEILQHSLEKRGDYSYLFDQMNGGVRVGLDLREFPSPFSENKLYMVRQNGNHRAGVFRAIGLPAVTGVVEVSRSDRWNYYGGNCAPVGRYLMLLKSVGLIASVERDDFSGYTITPNSGLAIWILPGRYVQSTFSLVRDVGKRIELIERMFPDFANEIPRILKSRFLWVYVLASRSV